MDDFHKMSPKTDVIREELEDLKSKVSKAVEYENRQKDSINDLADRVNAMLSECNDNSQSLTKLAYIEIDELNDYVNNSFLEKDDRTKTDKKYDLNSVDYLITSLAGGMAVLVDFLVVKIPRDMKFSNDGKTYYQKGSCLTELFDKIGVNKSGDERKWIKVLERWFKVPYDKSLDPEIKGMYPKNHRIFSLAHDPSFSGLIWAVKDIVQGTFSYIDEKGILRVMKCTEANYLRLFYAPIVWLGHIISDIFTRQSIPIPGASLLRLLQFGSIGEKERTIAEIATYMYERGYNMKHFATMSVSNAVIEIIVRLYDKLTKENPLESMLMSENEYSKVMSTRKLHRMLIVSYSIATCGNIAKIAAYQGNPFAINVTIWYGFIKEAIVQLEILEKGDSTQVAIERRHVIDENFKKLMTEYV